MRAKFGGGGLVIRLVRNRDFSDSFVLSGTSAKFCITFELAWKVMKDILVQYYAITGFVTGSPKEVLKQSFKTYLITDGRWLDMLRVRNELSHDYDDAVIRAHCGNIIGIYSDLFTDLEERVDKLLSNPAG
ncbi:MAG: nucleotidyltransferase substrate binding protein [Lachnospiraceae bacterium]|nr:nucleotidyltransferase substrate binding protein [Lachnospiraceae bacterium]